jgi:hypothetical protein
MRVTGLEAEGKPGSTDKKWVPKRGVVTMQHLTLALHLTAYSVRSFVAPASGSR